LADTIGQLVYHTSFQFNGTLLLTLSGAAVVMVSSFLDLSSGKPAVGWLLGFALPLPFAFPLFFGLSLAISSFLCSFGC
jgi:hypothetical protein